MYGHDMAKPKNKTVKTEKFQIRLTTFELNCLIRNAKRYADGNLSAWLIWAGRTADPMPNKVLTMASQNAS